MEVWGEGQVRALIQDTLLAQRGSMFGWVPVCLGIGIGCYYALGQEPDLFSMIGVGFAALALAVAARLANVAYAPLLIALVLVFTGIGLAKWRTEMVAAPTLGFRYYGAIEGRVVKIDRSGSDAIRLTLDHVVLARMSPNRTPARVRVSLHGDQVIPKFQPGDVIVLTGHLSPPAGPAK